MLERSVYQLYFLRKGASFNKVSLFNKICLLMWAMSYNKKKYAPLDV